MKLKLFVIPLFIGQLLFAQNIPLGPEQFEGEGYISTGDEMIDSLYYYKNTEVTLKAGDGIYLYMLARDFEPQLLTLDKDKQEWGYGDNDFFGDDAFIAFKGVIAKNDTSFYSLYTSQYEFDTGAFVYGIRKLNAAQMEYNNSMSFCDRLTYLINHWQCNWGIIPVQSDGTEESAVYETKNTLLNGNTGTFYFAGQTDYKEIIYSGNDKELANKQYNDLLSQIDNCLDKELWDVNSDVQTDEESGAVTIVTNFIIKGGAATQEGFCFSLQYVKGATNTNDVFILFY